MSTLADTNILLRRTQPDHPNHAAAVESVAKLLAAGEPIYFTLQNISEFWNVATRPVGNAPPGKRHGVRQEQSRRGSAKDRNTFQDCILQPAWIVGEAQTKGGHSWPGDWGQCVPRRA